MDELVRQALLKWPDVPDCFGWLALDARGRWRIGAEKELITHRPTVEFIGRNYSADPEGRWRFQNGPQRVYVDLEYTPFVWRLLGQATSSGLVDHLGHQAARPERIFLDDSGRFLIACDARIGVVHDHDSAALIDSICSSEGNSLGALALDDALEGYFQGAGINLSLRWDFGSDPIPIERLLQAEVADRFRFEPHPSGRG